LEIDPQRILLPTVGGKRAFTGRSAVLSMLIPLIREVVEAKCHRRQRERDNEKL
jgi:hypothetical protein